jgi:hypothetical protein
MEDDHGAIACPPGLDRPASLLTGRNMDTDDLGDLIKSSVLRPEGPFELQIQLPGTGVALGMALQQPRDARGNTGKDRAVR